MCLLILWIISLLVVLWFFKEIIFPKKNVPLIRMISNEFFYSFILFTILLLFLVSIIAITQPLIPISPFVDNTIIIILIISLFLIFILILFFLIKYLIKNTLFIVNTIILLKDKKPKENKGKIFLIALAIISMILFPILIFANFYSSLTSFVNLSDDSDKISLIEYVYYSIAVSHSLSLPDDSIINAVQEEMSKNDLLKIIPSMQVIGQKIIDIFFLGFIATILTNVFWKSQNDKKINTSMESKQLDELNNLNNLVETSKLKKLLTVWNKNTTNNSQHFWQTTLSENASILSHIFSNSILDFKDGLYLGGKKSENKGDKIADFIYQNNLTKDIALIEVKAPNTKLLSKEYKSESFSINTELTEAVIQVLEYKEKIINDYTRLRTDNEKGFNIFDPQSFVIAGNLDELDETEIHAFELYRNELNNITIITYDELFERVELLLNLLNSDT